LLRVLLWVATFAVAYVVERVFLWTTPVWLEAPILLTAIGIAVSVLSGISFPGERLLFADVGIEALKGAILGIVLAVVLTVAHGLLKWSPGVLLPAMVWPTVMLWPERHKVL